ncbi:MAG: V-type ATP synthase subunit F [Spirochaetaceae bacterium]|jgi:V/A-type H+-transporting ATPase subunit F|nr:V-type ATP synthase subunit F [Spirochaetaceae bacterium]
MNCLFWGEDELVTAFRFTGVDGVRVEDAETARALFTVLAGGGRRQDGGVWIDSHDQSHNNNQKEYHILILSEQVAYWLKNELNDWQLSGRYPLIVEIPAFNAAESSGSRRSLVDAIREAIGIHV